jgi:hypothetical protein
MASRLIPKAPQPVHFVDLKKSAGILDDYAVRKNVATKEGTIEHVPTEDNHIVNKKYVDDEIAGIVIPAETDPISLHLDQTTPQTITNGAPIFAEGFECTNSSLTKWKTVIPDSNYAYIAGGVMEPVFTMGVYDGDFTVIASMSKTDTTFYTPISATNLSGTNTGDQDLSGYMKLDQTTPQTTVGTFRFPKVLVNTTDDGSGAKLQVKGNVIIKNVSGSASVLNVSSDGTSNSSYLQVVGGASSPEVQQGFWLKSAPSGERYRRFGFDYNGGFGIGVQLNDALTEVLSAPLNIAPTTQNILIHSYWGASTGKSGLNFTDDGVNALQVGGSAIFKDKISFTQTDGNEYIDSLNDGYMDYGATTAHRFLANVKLTADNRKLILGAGDDASIYYDGTNFIINPKVVGSGILDVAGVVQTDGYNSADGSAGITVTDTIVTDIRMNAGQLQKKTKTIIFKDGIRTDTGAESDWTDTTDI